MSRIHELEEIILKAKEAYYTTGTSIMPDSEYDKLEDELRTLDPNNRVLGMVGIKDGEVDLIYPMLSTDKSLSMEELSSYWSRSNKVSSPKEYVISQKVDGMAIDLTYVKGILVEATTRGDGKFGKSFINKVKDMICFPKKLDEPFTGKIRGECYLTYEAFDKLQSILLEEGSDLQKNVRNSVAGLINSDNLANADKKRALLSFKAYGVFEEGK